MWCVCSLKKTACQLLDLRGDPKKRVSHPCLVRERTQNTSFGWTGDHMARHMGVNDKDFCPTVVWPIKLVQVLEHSCVDLELLKIKQSNKTTDFNSEYNT